MRALFVVSLLALLAGPAACEGKSSVETTRGRTVRTDPLGAIASFGGRTLTGDEVSLDEHRGKVILLNVWATWCTPCRDELPELQRLHTHFAERGFMVVGVSVDKPAALGRARGLVEELGLTYPNIFDPDGLSVETFDVSGYPTSFLIGRDGRIRWRRNGLIRPDDDEVLSEIRAALAEPS